MVVLEAIAFASVVSAMVGATRIYSFRKSLFPRRYLRKRMNKQVEQFPLATTKLIQNPNLEQDLKHATESYVGVFVLWVPHGTGKTTYLRAFGAQLQAEGRDVIFITLNASRAMGPLWFREELDLAESDENLNELFPELVHDDKPVVIIMDQFDTIRVTEQQRLIVYLAQQSIKTRKFMVILAVSNASKAAEILQWNHGRKISLLPRRLLGLDPERYKWSEAMMAELFATVNDPRRDQFIEMGTIGGVVGDLIPILTNPQLISPALLEKYQSVAQAHSLEWKSGTDLVTCASQEANDANQALALMLSKKAAEEGTSEGAEQQGTITRQTAAQSTSSCSSGNTPSLSDPTDCAICVSTRSSILWIDRMFF